MDKITEKDLKIGQKVLLKNRQQLLACGYRYTDDMLNDGVSPYILDSMMPFLGQIVTISLVCPHGSDSYFKIKEGVEHCSWALNTIARLYDVSEEKNKCHISFDEIINHNLKLVED